MSFGAFGRLRRFGAVDRALLLLSVICSFFYLVTQSFQPYPGSVLLKVLIYSLLLSQWLAPSLGAVAGPVMLYICVITAMAVAAILARFSKPWVYSGVILFLISDSILAVDKFKSPVPLSGYLVWATYYLAQFGIAIGFLQEKIGEKQYRER